MTEEQQALRDRVLIIEIEKRHMKEQLDEALEAIHKLSNSTLKLQQTLDAFTNQGKGMQLLVKGFLAIGGLGWLAGMVAFFQQFTGK